MSISIQSLEQENQQLKAHQQQLEAHQKHLENQLEQYRQAFNALQSQLNDLLRHRFGQRSERDIDPEHPQVDWLTNDAAQKPCTSDESAIDIPAHQRRKKTKKNTDQYPRVIEIIPVPEEDKRCTCGQKKRVIRYEVKECFDYIPAVFRIIEQRREVVACPKGCSSIQTAAAPKQVLPKIKATESLLAHIAVAKFHDRQPLYHLERYGRNIDVSRETMARWMIQLVKPLQPIFNLMKDRILDNDVSSIDATSLQVLDEPGRLATTKSYIYCLRGGPPDQPVVLYGYNAAHHKPFVDDWLEGFAGTIHMDADSFFDHLLKDPKVVPSYCNAHARRYFEKVKKQAKKAGLAHEALRYYKKLYQVEREAKERSLTPEQRYALRQEKAQPVMLEFYQWLEAHAAKDGRLEIDNNLTEQEIKPLVIARKNFMFAQSVKGAHAIAMHMSIIRSALVNRQDPYQYYHALLKRLPHCQTVEDYEALLPCGVLI